MLGNNRKDEMGSVKIIAPIVGFTSDVETLDFGEFVICKVRTENLHNFLRSMRITGGISNEIAAQLLSNYLLCYEFPVEEKGKGVNPSDKTWMRIENLVKTFRLYKSGNVRNYWLFGNLRGTYLPDKSSK